MRGTITANLGDSQYEADVTVSTACLELVLAKANEDLADITEQLQKARDKYWELKEQYDDLLNALYVASDGYAECMLAFDLGDWTQTRRLEIEDARYDCRQACEAEVNG